jgi:hypothetical protein
MESVETGVERWLRLTTDPPEAEAELTVAELAALLDELVGVPDPCVGSPVATAADPIAKLEDALDGPDCGKIATDMRLGAKCKAARRIGLPINRTVYAHWSDEAFGYHLLPLGSAKVLSGPVRSRKTINLIIDVSDASSAPVRYYVDAVALDPLWRKKPPRWLGNVIEDKRIVAGPDISLGGGKVDFGGRVVSGRIELWLPIICDIWTVSLLGVWLGDGKRNYAAKFLGTSELLDQPAEVDIKDETEGNPDADDCSVCGGSPEAFEPPENADIFCYEEVVTEARQLCNDRKLGPATVEYRQVPCPTNTLPELNAGTGAILNLPDYISRQMTLRIAKIASSDYNEITWHGYVDSCGYAPVRDICKPSCRKITRTWRGQRWTKREEDIKSKHHSDTEIIYIGPDDGICGKRVDSFSSSFVAVKFPIGSYIKVIAVDNQLIIYGYDGIIYDSGFAPTLIVNEEVDISGESKVRVEGYNLWNGYTYAGWVFQYEVYIAGELSLTVDARGEIEIILVYTAEHTCT